MRPRLRHISGIRAGSRVTAPAPAARRIGLAGMCDLLRIAMGAGIALPRALTVAGACAGWEQISESGRMLARGSSWEGAWRWTALDAKHDSTEAQIGRQLAAELGESWEKGNAPGPALRALARSARQASHREAQEAVAKLGVRLVLPLGLCYLPAFFLVGVLPLVLGVLADVF